MIRFIFREGTSILFSIVIVIFTYASSLLDVESNYVGMFGVALVALIYLGVQMQLAAFSRVGEDMPLIDMFFSLIPLITLVVIGVLALTGMAPLSLFQVLSLVLAGVVTMLDVVMNTQVVFKMNRLATDMVQMR